MIISNRILLNFNHTAGVNARGLEEYLSRSNSSQIGIAPGPAIPELDPEFSNNELRNADSNIDVEAGSSR